MTRLRRLASKLAALLLLLLTGLAAWGGAIQPWAAHKFALDERIEDQRRVLGRYLDAAREPQDTKLLETRLAALSNERLFLEGESDAVKSAKLQAEVVRLSQRQRIRFERTRILPAIEAGGLRLIGIEASFTATLGQFKALMASLDAARPMLLVRGLRMTPAPMTANGDGDRLRIAVSVFGAAGEPALEAGGDNAVTARP